MSVDDTRVQPGRSSNNHRRRTSRAAVGACAFLLVIATVLPAHDLLGGARRPARELPTQTVDVATQPAGELEAPDDSAAVAAVVDRFHAAIVAGDTALAMSLLAPDAVVLESGGIETREEFRAGHLAADIAFAQAVKSERGPKRVVVRGDAAWVTSTSASTGEYRARQVNSSGAELMVLTRTPQGWRISAIHWSSRTRRPPGG